MAAPSLTEGSEHDLPMARELNSGKIREEKLLEGASLTREESGTSYAIIRHNIRTYRSAGVVEVLKGRQNAEAALKVLEAGQSSGDRHEGWRYFLEKTDIKPGMDPARATDLRQTQLESRESDAAKD